MTKHHNFKVRRNTSDNNLFQVSKFLEMVYRYFSNTYELTWTAELSHISYLHTPNISKKHKYKTSNHLQSFVAKNY